MTVNDTDKFLVNRSSSSYQIEAQNLMAELQDTDLMLVNRGGIAYKATGAEIKDSLNPSAKVKKPQIIAPANGAGAGIIPVTDEIISKDNAVKTTTYEFKQTNDQGQDWNDPLPPQHYNGATLVQSNISVGSPPSTNTSFRYAYFDLGTISAMTFGRVSPDGLCEAKLWGTNDPTQIDSWEFIGVGNSTDGRRRVTGYGYRYYCYTAHYLSQTALIAMQSSTHYAVALSIEALTFKTDKDLYLLNVSDILTDNTTSATGEITRIDVAGNTVTLDGIVGTFNIGDTCSGEEVPSSDAPDPNGVNFVGTEFISSDGSLLPASADWQVAALADSGYSSPISQVSKHPDMGPPPQWTAGALEGATEYRARTKYYSTTGEESDWSDDVTFTTAADDSILSQPYQTMFYSELLSSALTSGTVKFTYGIDPDNDSARAALIGIYPLTEAPEGYSPTHYVKEDSTYRAIPHEFSNAEREAMYRVKAVGASIQEFVSDCIPNWDPTVDYFAGTFVEHNGSIWQAVSASTDVEPVVPEDPEEINEDWSFVR